MKGKKIGKTLLSPSFFIETRQDAILEGLRPSVHLFAKNGQNRLISNGVFRAK